MKIHQPFPIDCRFKSCSGDIFKAMEKKHSYKKWEVSISEYEMPTGKEWKVTRRLPEMAVAETKVFTSKEEAIKQYEEWLR